MFKGNLKGNNMVKYVDAEKQFKKIKILFKNFSICFPSLLKHNYLSLDRAIHCKFKRMHYL